MSELNFIPGPWQANPSVPSDGFECVWLMCGSGEIGCVNGPQSLERLATARLISQAPAMYEALRNIAEYHRHPGDVGQIARDVLRIVEQ